MYLIHCQKAGLWKQTRSLTGRSRPRWARRPASQSWSPGRLAAHLLPGLGSAPGCAANVERWRAPVGSCAPQLLAVLNVKNFMFKPVFCMWSSEGWWSMGQGIKAQFPWGLTSPPSQDGCPAAWFLATTQWPPLPWLWTVSCMRVLVDSGGSHTPRVPSHWARPQETLGLCNHPANILTPWENMALNSKKTLWVGKGKIAGR